ncbi:MAG: hypothetical protein HUK40_06185 [Desulfobacter sp.]|nr:hypothetical protein [Desulfobacter sp.]WDP84933.1 MAG: hypothetical protein HUN05_07010 [Desulfobacter sp.]
MGEFIFKKSIVSIDENQITGSTRFQILIQQRLNPVHCYKQWDFSILAAMCYGGPINLKPVNGYEFKGDDRQIFGHES